MKICSTCKIKKDSSCFHKKTREKDGLYNECKECRKVKHKKYYENNKEKIKAVTNTYKKNNPKKVKIAIKTSYEKKLNYYKEQKTKWRKNNPHKLAGYLRTYKSKNYGKVVSWGAKYKANKRKAIPPWFEKELVETVYKKAKEWGFTVDHIVPLQSDIVCGLHCWSNLQLLHPSLNYSKGNKYWVDMP